MNRLGKFILAGSVVAVLVCGVNSGAQTKKTSATSSSISEMEKQKSAAETEIKETKAELGANERKVNEGLSSLRKIEGEIKTSEIEIEKVRGQIALIQSNINTLEASIATEEAELKVLREEYRKAIKKMRVARKQNSDLAFIFASGSFNEARRRMRYMKEFSEWRDRRSDEILGKVNVLKDQRASLQQAQSDADVALKRETAVRDKLAKQKSEQQQLVAALRENSESLKAKLAKRQSEARKLSNQISALIAEQRAKEAREAEERRRAEEKLAAERKAAEEKRLAEEKAKAEASKAAEPSSSEYAEARKRKPRNPSTAATAETKPTEQAPVASTESGFGGMKGKLPKPVGGSFNIVSAVGVHPISPELPDLMDENLGIDAHVANGAVASAVYDGEVIKIYDRTNTPGFRNIIVVKHGDYITVYANLETLSVKTGQHVKQGQSLGTVGTDFDDPNYGLIHFEVWKNQTNLDPAGWIKI